MPQPPVSKFRISLKAFLIALVGGGAVLGLMGRWMLRNPDLFRFVLSVGSTVLPFLCAVATVIWLGAKQGRRAVVLWGIVLLLTPVVGMGALAVFSQYAGNFGFGMMTTAPRHSARTAKPGGRAVGMA